MRPETIKFENGMPVRAYVRSIEHYPYHWHDTLEIIQVLKGSVDLGVGDHNLTLHENDIAVINIEELHRIDQGAGETGDNKILFVQVDSSFYRSLLPDNSYIFLYCCSTYHEAEVPQKYEKLRKYIALLTSALMGNSCGEPEKNIESILAAMLDYLTYNFDFLRWGYGTTPFNEKLVERLKQIAIHINSDFNVRLKLKELADEVGISLQHLCYNIKEKFGLTFQELLYDSRCEYAAKLLLSTEERIIDISLECGFSDVKYFVKSFRQHFHLRPSEFRKAHQADIRSLSSQMQYREYPLYHACIQGNISE